jgi:hypothetical protein
MRSTVAALALVIAARPGQNTSATNSVFKSAKTTSQPSEMDSVEAPMP